MNFLDLQSIILDSTLVRVFVEGKEYILPNETLKMFDKNLLNKEVIEITILTNSNEEAYLDVKLKE